MKNNIFSLKNLIEIDAHLNLKNGAIDEQLDILAPCDLSNISQNHFLFIKDKKFLIKVLSYFESNKIIDFGTIICSKLLEKLSDDEINKLFKSTSWTLSSKCMDTSLNIISKYYYDELENLSMPLVDGRQMSSVQIDPTAKIAQNVTIGAHVIIGANVMIHSGAVIMSSCEIKKGSVIYPNVTIYPRVIIGENCRIHSSSVIGSDGFGYNFVNGKHLKVWHMGGVFLGDDVEIGGNTCVDSGTFSPTKIGVGTKLDNHVQIGHNSDVGQGVIMCGQAGIAGSSKVGDFSVFGGRAALGNGLELGKACQVAGGAMVTGNWPDASRLGGHPARNLKEWMKGLAFIRKESLKK